MKTTTRSKSFKPINYDQIVTLYQSAQTKPDKLFSTLPTVLKLAGNIKGKIVLDLGCGDGFFCVAMHQQNANVIGVDNSKEQLKLAKKNLKSGNFLFRDLFIDPIPDAHVVLAPYVINYSETKHQLQNLLTKIYRSLHNNGKLVGVIDLPQNKDLRKFGSEKIVHKKVDGDEIKINLFNSGEQVCTLRSVFYKKTTVEKTLREIGFKNVKWHAPIISPEGKKILGETFWKGYQKNCDLGYFTATKK